MSKYFVRTGSSFPVLFFCTVFFLIHGLSPQALAQLAKTKPQDTNQKIGVFSSFQELIEASKTNYLKKLEQLKAKKNDIKEVGEGTNIKLDSDFLSSLLFYTPTRYLALALNDRCSLYDLITANLAKSVNGNIQNFIVTYTYKNQTKTALINRKNFFKLVVNPECPKVETFKQYFDTKNIKNTLKNIELKTPKDKASCLEIHKSFINDHKTPYLCKISDSIAQNEKIKFAIKNTLKSNYRELKVLKRKLRLSNTYTAALNSEAVDYLSSLCLHTENPELFCDHFFKESFWQKVIEKKRSKYFLKNMCEDLTSKTTLSKKEYNFCANSFDDNPRLCHFLGKSESVLLPKDNCEDLGLNLNQSRLYSNYYDCPAKVGDLSVVNVSRILNHFQRSAYTSKKFCALNSTLPFTEFLFETNEGSGLDIKMCYDNKIYDRKECFPMVYGEEDSNKYSMSRVVKLVLSKTKGMGASENCEIIRESSFRPELLKFKSGCFILLSDTQCFGTSCDFKVLYNQREVKNLQVTSKVSLDYFPKDFQGENFALDKLLKTKLKLKSKRIINAISVKRFFSKNSNGIIHGLSCAEDLYPRMFKRSTLNKCSPVPFIIDGYKERDGLFSVNLRSAIDSLHAPRSVPWSYLFSSLVNFKNIHPLRSWGLYALYK